MKRKHHTRFWFKKKKNLIQVQHNLKCNPKNNNNFYIFRSETDVRDSGSGCNHLKPTRRISTVSLSPRFQRRVHMIKSRTPSSDSFAQALANLNVKTNLSRTAIANNLSITPSPSRKTSTKSELCPVVEGDIIDFSQCAQKYEKNSNYTLSFPQRLKKSIVIFQFFHCSSSKGSLWRNQCYLVL